MPLARFEPYRTFSAGKGNDFSDLRLQGMGATHVYELTPAIQSLNWSESLQNAGITGNIELVDPDKKLLALQRGERFRLLWREDFGRPNSPMRELHRFVMWDRARRSSTASTIRFGFHDMLIYLMTSEDHFLFQKDGKHKKGWTATEITLWLANKYKIPLGRIVQSKVRIPYLRLEQSSIYDCLLKAWSYDRERSGRKYVIRAIHDKLHVFPKRTSTAMWQYDEETNLIDSEFISSLEGMYTAVTVIGSRETNTTGIPDVRVTVKHKQKADKYGYLHKLITLEGVGGRETALKIARNALLTTLRENLDGKVDGFGIPYLRAGDPIAVRDTQSGIVGQFWISDVSHTISGGAFTTSIGLNWMDVVPSQLPSESELHPPASGYSGGANGAAGALEVARQQIGIPYAWGGGTKAGPSKGVGHGDTETTGFDCSGLTLFVFGTFGIDLPHHTDAQAQMGQPVPLGQEQPGDLVFYGPSAGQPGTNYAHVAIFSGNGNVIEAVRPTVKEGPHPGWIVVRRFPQLSQVQNEAAIGGGAGTFPGAAAGKAAIAQWMGGKAAAAGLPPELPVMAALPESGLNNSAVGDNGNAVGFFQIWPNRAQDDGFDPATRTDPEMQITWFIQEALQVKSRFASRGESAYGEWCQAVEISRHPDKYQPRLAEARALLGFNS